MKLGNLITVLSFSALAMVFAPSANAIDTLIYDSISSANGITRTNQGRPVAVGREVTGNAFNNLSTPVGALVTSMDFYLSTTNSLLTDYQSIRIRTQFWNNFGASLAPDWFANAAGTVQSQDLTTFGTLPSNVSLVGSGGSVGDTFSLYLVSINLPQPVLLTDNSLNGLVFNIQGNTGSGFVNTTDLSTWRTRGTGFAVGSSAINSNGGYFVNQNNRTDFNFTNDGDPAPPNDLQSPSSTTANEALAVRLYAVVPEAGTVVLLALGAVPLAGVVLRRRKK